MKKSTQFVFNDEDQEQYGKCETCKNYGKCYICGDCDEGSEYVYDNRKGEKA